MIQTTMFDSSQATHKKPSQAKRMLNLLRQRGGIGVRNYEFVTLLHILNYKGRKHELTRAGWNIEVKYTPQYGEGVYTYKLIPEGVSNDTD